MMSRIAITGAIPVIASLIVSCASNPTTPSSSNNASSGLSLSATTPVVQENRLQLRLPAALNFSGAVSVHENKGQANSVMYAGDAGLVGLFAQVAIHAGISNSAQAREARRKQEEANVILADFQASIDTINSDLLDSTLNDLKFATAESESNASLTDFFDTYSVDTNVSISQQKDGFILGVNFVNEEHVLSKEKEPEIYSIKVLKERSGAYSSGDEWLLASSNSFQDQVLSAYRQAIGQFVNRYENGLPTASLQKTYRYKFNNKRRYVRASLLSEDCNGQVLEDLSGSLFILPKKDQPECEV